MMGINRNGEWELKRSTNDSETGCLREQSGSAAPQARMRGIALRPAVLLVVAIALVACLAVPAYAWLSSSAEARSAKFEIPYSVPQINVQKNGETVPVTSNEDDGTFGFDVEAGAVYEVSITATSTSPSCIVVTAEGLPRTYVSGALASKIDAGASTNEAIDEASLNESLNFTICLSAARKVVISPHWGAFADLDVASVAADKDENILFVALTPNMRIGVESPAASSSGAPVQESTDSEEGPLAEIPGQTDTASSGS